VPLVETETWDLRLYRWYGNTLGVLVVAYLAFDRGVAHFHIPRTPAFIGELTLTLGALAIAVGTGWLRRAVVGDPLMGTVLAWMLWGLFRTVPNMHIFGIQITVRDAALWYYAGFAVALVAAATAVPDLPRRLVRAFWWVVPALTVWLPIGLILQREGVKGPRFKYSSVPLLSHKPGNTCVAALLCLAFILLVASGDRRSRNGEVQRDRLLPRGYGPHVAVALIAINVLTILLGGTQTRGGALAALIAMVLVFAFMPRQRRSRIFIAFVASLVLVIGLGLATGAAFQTKHRTISVSQLFENAQSIEGGANVNPGLNGSVTFRLSLWSTIVQKQSSTSHLLHGYGFGPNLAKIGGLNPRPNQPVALQLRSAHNSWLDIFARMGIIGGVLWLLILFGWFRRMARARRWLVDDDDTRSVIEVCICTAVAILVNCFFDPTLESAQVAAVFYTAFGLGVVCASRPIMSSTAARARAQRRPVPAARPV